MSQRARVVELYKKMLRLGKLVDSGGFVRTKCHKMFKRYAGLTDYHEIEFHIKRGEFMLKDLEKLNDTLKKFKAE